MDIAMPGVNFFFLPASLSFSSLESATLVLAQADNGSASSLDELGKIPYVVLSGYLVLLLFLGLFGWLKSRLGEEDYYLASRQQGWMVSSLTIMATFFSSFALLGAPGMVYREGIVFALYSLNVPVAGVCVYLLGSRIWKAGRRFGYVTPGDMIGDYYGSRVSLRLLVALAGFLYAIPYIVMQIQAGGVLSEELLGDGTFAYGAVTLACITMAYIMIGGMRSVAWTDLIQGLLLISGMLVSGFAMLLLFDGPAEFGNRVLTDLPASSLTVPGNTGYLQWPMLFTICLLASSGSMVQPAQWMRFYSADSVRALKRSAVIFAAVLATCFILGVMLIGVAGQILYPLTFTLTQTVEGTPPAVTVPEELSDRLTYDAGQGSQGELRWSWSGNQGRNITATDRAYLLALDDSPEFQRAVTQLVEQTENEQLLAAPAAHPEIKDFNSILVAVLKRQLPRQFGGFGMVFASLIIVAIMAASMSTADSNLHALSAVATRDIYDKFVRPSASERERVWIGRTIIAGATIFSLLVVIVGQDEQSQAKYDFLGMIAKMGLMAIAFSAQLLPIAVDVLFLQRGTGKGAAAGLAAGLLGAFLYGPLFVMLVDAAGAPAALATLLSAIDSTKQAAPIDATAWGLLFNIPVFVLISLITSPPEAEKVRQFRETFGSVNRD
jgi:Na+/proline symporter